MNLKLVVEQFLKLCEYRLLNCLGKVCVHVIFKTLFCYPISDITNY